MKTLKTLLLIAAIATSSTVFAASAEYMDTATRIDAAVATGKYPAGTTDEARQLRAESERMMKEGKEAEAMQLLQKAKELLNMK